MSAGPSVLDGLDFVLQLMVLLFQNVSFTIQLNQSLVHFLLFLGVDGL